jgi:hypothetical protein
LKSAPDCGHRRHSIGLFLGATKAHGEIRVTERDVPGLGRCHLVDGSPADCVRIGVSAGRIPRPARDLKLSRHEKPGKIRAFVFGRPA